MIESVPLSDEALRVARYLAAGATNTLFGFSLIFVLMEIVGLSPHHSNLIAYVATFFSSYALQKWVTFRRRGLSGGELIRFAVVYVAAYAVNAIALAVLVWLIPPLPAQAGAMACFVCASYAGQRLYVFATRRERSCG